MKPAALLFLSAALFGAATSARAATPCTTVGPACTEFVKLGGGPAQSLVYRTDSLTAPNPAIQRALIMVHGTNRNADHYFLTSIGAALSLRFTNGG